LLVNIFFSKNLF